MNNIVHYHGGPLWGGGDLLKALYSYGGALVSFARPDQIKKIIKLDCKIILDNGAFSTWKKKKDNTFDWSEHWTEYYSFVNEYYHRIEGFIIPDVIEGTEKENDLLLSKCPRFFIEKAIPVWHSDESIDRLIRLCREFKTVAVGCCGEHRSIRSEAWKNRMTEAFHAVYITEKLDVKIHGLRMLDGRALSQFPFASADSTNVAINTPKTKARLPAITDKLHRVGIMRHTIEMIKPPTIREWINLQNNLDR